MCYFKWYVLYVIAVLQRQQQVDATLQHWGSRVNWSDFSVHQTAVHISCLLLQYTSVYLHRSIYTVLYSKVVSFHLCSVCQATTGVGKIHLFSTHLFFGESLVHKATNGSKTTNNITLIKGKMENVINSNFINAIFSNPFNYIFNNITTFNCYSLSSKFS
jgi:hypothetical protein